MKPREQLGDDGAMTDDVALWLSIATLSTLS